jgi:ubiquinone/menaquinone biosynthesis C-methylase UbiE
VISPKHVLAEALRLLKPTGTIYILEQLNLPTDNEHPHSLKLEWFDDWVQASGLHVKKRTLQQDMILDSQNPSQPGTGYCVLCLIVTPIAA